APGMKAPAVEAIDLAHTYAADGIPVHALNGVSLTVERGEVVAVMGPNGTDWDTLKGPERARFRRRTCGFIVQGLALLPQATAAENVEVPLLLDGIEPAARDRRVAGALERVGLAQHSVKLTDQLSGGQQQRVAIARALVAEPAVVLADEPTGGLDSVTGPDIVRLLVAAARERDAAVVMVTHDPTVAAHADRVVAM